MTTEVIIGTLDDVDFGVFEHIETRTRTAVDGGPMKPLVYRSWRGRCAGLAADILVSSEERPPKIDESVRRAYRSVLSDPAAFKTDVARRALPLARDWVAADGMEVDFDEAEFASMLRFEGILLDKSRLTIWLEEGLDIFAGHAIEVRIENEVISEVGLMG